MAKGKMDDMVEGGASGEDLALPETGILSMYTQQPEFSPEDVRMPYLRLAQGLTAEVQEGTARPGQYVVEGFAAEKDVTLIPVGFAKMQELRTADEKRERLCFSSDALQGTGEPGGACTQCEFNEWRPPEEEGGKNRPPICRFSYGYLFYSEQHDTILGFQFKGKALSVAKKLNTVVNHHGMGKIAVTMGSETKTTPGGSTYFVPTIAVIADTDPALIESAARALAGA